MKPLLLVVTCLLTFAYGHPSIAANARPNVVFIIIDNGLPVVFPTA